MRELLSTKSEYAKERWYEVTPRSVYCRSDGKKESPFSRKKEMRDFASYPCKKTREGTERTLKNWGETP